jgi:hypothetical protein
MPAEIGPPPQTARGVPGSACQILRSVGPWYVDSLLPWERQHYSDVAPEGIHEVYLALVQAIGAAQRYLSTSRTSTSTSIPAATTGSSCTRTCGRRRPAG